MTYLLEFFCKKISLDLLNMYLKICFLRLYEYNVFNIIIFIYYMKILLNTFPLMLLIYNSSKTQISCMCCKNRSFNLL